MSLVKLQLNLVWCLALLGLGLTSTGIHGAELVLRERFIPTGAVIHLGDIADIHAADGVEARRLATTPLWSAPTEGEQRFATVTAIRDALRLQGLDPQGLTFSGATRVAIGMSGNNAEAKGAPVVPPQEPAQSPLGTGFRPPRGASSEATLASPAQVLLASERNELAERFEDEVLIYLEQMSGNVGHMDVDLRLSNQQIDLLGRHAASSPILSGGRAPWTGRQLLTAEFASSTGRESFTFAIDVLDTTPVLVAKRALTRGQTITASDVELQVPTRDMRIAPSRPLLREIDEALGLETSRAIRPGEVVTADLCLAPLMIERNQIVTVTIAGGGFELSRQAKATAPARLGDFAEVQLLNSKERLAARVVGPGKLAIADTAPATAAAPAPSRPRKYQP